MFSPVTPRMPNRLNSHPPITAPTMPSAMSRKNPSPDLLTSLLPINPAIRPSTTHEMIDMVLLSFRGRHRFLSLLDHLIRPRQQRWRDREAEGLGGLEVEAELEGRRLLDWQVAWLRAFENLVD